MILVILCKQLMIDDVSTNLKLDLQYNIIYIRNFLLCPFYHMLYRTVLINAFYLYRINLY